MVSFFSFTLLICRKWSNDDFIKSIDKVTFYLSKKESFVYPVLPGPTLLLWDWVEQFSNVNLFSFAVAIDEVNTQQKRK